MTLYSEQRLIHTGSRQRQIRAVREYCGAANTMRNPILCPNRGQVERWRSEIRREQGGRGQCRVPGCSRAHHSRGMCQAHYRRWEQTGDVQSTRPIRGHVRNEAASPEAS